MFNEGKTLHLERLVVADRHPGVHLRKTRVGVHEEVSLVVDKDVCDLLHPDLEVPVLGGLHIVGGVKSETESNLSRKKLKIMSFGRKLY